MTNGEDIGPCEEWVGPRYPSGYGKPKHGRYAHRDAYAAAHGHIPKGMCVRHRCDNPPCVKLSHLILGTHADNMADMVARGRQCKGERKAEIMRRKAARGARHGFVLHPELCPRGESNGHSKLTADNVIEIRRACSRKSESQSSLAIRFGVSPSTISEIARRLIWKHIEEASQ